MWKLGFQQVLKTSQCSVICKKKLLQQQWYNDDGTYDVDNNHSDLFFEGYCDDGGEDKESTKKIS